MLKVYKSNEEWRTLPKGAIKTTVLAGNGIFEWQKGWLGTSLKKVNNYETVIFPKLEDELTIENTESTPTIPKEAILYVIQWYSTITNKNGEEAQINFYYTKGKESITVDNKEVALKDIKGVHFWKNDLFSYTPLQYNSGSLTEVDDPIYTALNKQVGMYVETHSHNSMSAFASETDLANSKNDALQLVFGKLNTDEVEMHTWVTVCGVTREKITPEELALYVEMPTFTIRQGGKYYINKQELAQVNFDNKLLQIWNEQIKQKVYVPPVYSAKTTAYTNWYSTDSNKKNHNHQYYQTSWLGGYDKFNQGWLVQETDYTTLSRKLESTQEMIEEMFVNEYEDGEEPVFTLTLSEVLDIFTRGGNIGAYTNLSVNEIAEEMYDVVTQLEM